MSFTTATPPRLSELASDIVTTLDVASMQAKLGGTGLVVAGLITETPVFAAGSGKIGRIIVIRRDGPFPGSNTDLTRVYSPQFNLRVDCLKPTPTFDPDLFLSNLHAEIFTLLEGYSPTITYGKVTHPFRRIGPPSTPREDKPGKYFYSRSLFKIIVEPA